MPRLHLHSVAAALERDCRELPGRDEAVRKRFDTLRARAAFAGWELAASDDDRGRTVFVISRGALCQRLSTLDEVERWLVHPQQRGERS